MTMAFNIEKLRETGDPKDEARAAMIQSILDDRGEDIPLPEAGSLKYADTPEVSEEFSTAQLLPVEVKLAQYSLGDRTNKPIDILDNEDIERRLALDEAFIAITEPYYYAAQSKVPFASETRNWGKSEVRWQSEKDFGKRTVYYNYTLSYHNGKEANTAESLEVQFSLNEKPHKKDSFIRLSFDGNGASEVTFREAQSDNWNRLPELLKWMLAQQAGSEKVKRYTNTSGQDQMFAYPYDLYLLRLRNTPLAIVSESSVQKTEKIFNQKTGLFNSKTINTDALFRSKNSPKNRITRHNDLSAEYVLDFYSDLLSTIPLEETTL